ncbi:MurR/RpiR family transcriptional regulator [Carnobacterium gallinarum]|uniref:MurR/RpiR family transcriptional regulator n=1 Tax=Carnobacterium gallinarum TaxID=2749 RepID=UPI00055511EC|nr:MurR/RpiR family transcriptional regulator [Carnobacterium gallinarum]
MHEQQISLKIKAIYRDLSDKEKRVADYILAHQADIVHGTISTISDALDVADATVFRFCKRLGFKGFQAFKIALASEQIDESDSIHEHISKEDSEFVIAQKVFSSNIQALKDTSAILDESQMNRANQILNSAETIAFFGIGGSSVIAMDAYHKFMRSPLNCLFNIDSHFQLMQAAKLTKDDCAVVISHSGINKDILSIAKTAKEKGAKLIVITSYAIAPLAKLADALLLSTAEETDYRSEALASRITQLSLIDALFVNSMFKNSAASAKSLEDIRNAIANTKL